MNDSSLGSVMAVEDAKAFAEKRPADFGQFVTG